MDNKILIIENNDVVLDSCSLILKGSGYSIATTPDVARGLELTREFGPDLVLVDAQAPGISDLEVLDRIRAIDPNAMTIVITGLTTISLAVEAMKRGACDILPKPFTPDELRLIVQRGFEKRRLVLAAIAQHREKEVLRDQFAAIISHELRSPLGAIQQSLMALQMELEDKLDEEQKGRLKRLQGRIDELWKLIHTWSRVISADATRLCETFRPVSLAAVASKAVENVLPQVVRKDIHIVVAIEATPGMVNGDEEMLVQALVNLLENAVRYSHAGSDIQVRVNGEQDGLVLSVTDTGIGIPQDELPFIFEDFFAGRTGQRVEKSSGLGLAITRRIVEMHDGTITVDSEFGHGSTFAIRLPVRQQ